MDALCLPQTMTPQNSPCYLDGQQLASRVEVRGMRNGIWYMRGLREKVQLGPCVKKGQLKLLCKQNGTVFVVQLYQWQLIFLLEEVFKVGDRDWQRISRVYQSLMVDSQSDNFGFCSFVKYNKDSLDCFIAECLNFSEKVVLILKFQQGSVCGCIFQCFVRFCWYKL